jgi:hypothetical protein
LVELWGRSKDKLKSLDPKFLITILAGFVLCCCWGAFVIRRARSKGRSTIWFWWWEDTALKDYDPVDKKLLVLAGISFAILILMFALD